MVIDGIIIENKKVLLIKRVIEPFRGCWVLPGGHVEYGEKVEEAVTREMKEELGVSVKIKKLIGIYSNPKRDPRYHSVAVAFLCQKTKGGIRLNRESSEYNYFPLKKMPPKIGFDHRKMINDLRSLLK